MRSHQPVPSSGNPVCPRLLASTAAPRASSQSAHGIEGGSTGSSARSRCSRCEIQCPGEPPAAPVATGGQRQLILKSACRASMLSPEIACWAPKTSQQLHRRPEQTLPQYVMSKKVQEHFPGVSLTAVLQPRSSRPFRRSPPCLDATLLLSSCPAAETLPPSLPVACCRCQPLHARRVPQLRPACLALLLPCRCPS